MPYTRIQSGQAFLVHSSGAGGTVSFTENAKIINNANNMVFRGSSLPASRQFVRVQLYTSAGDIADGAVVAFDPQFNNLYDANDAVKMANGGENLGIRHTNGKLLSIEARSLVQRTDTVFLDFSNLKNKPTSSGSEHKIFHFIQWKSG